MCIGMCTRALCALEAAPVKWVRKSPACLPVCVHTFCSHMLVSIQTRAARVVASAAADVLMLQEVERNTAPRAARKWSHVHADEQPEVQTLQPLNPSTLNSQPPTLNPRPRTPVDRKTAPCTYTAHTSMDRSSVCPCPPSLLPHCPPAPQPTALSKHVEEFEMLVYQGHCCCCGSS
jgi:hypothetical protein